MMYSGSGLEQLAGARIWQESDEVFCLVDKGSMCVVDPDGAVVIPSVTQKRMSNGGYRLKEKYVLEGDPMCVIGELRSQYAVAPEHDESVEVATLIRAWKRDRYRQLVAAFDRNGDNLLDQDEWHAVREQASERTRRERRLRERRTELNIVRAPRDGRPFLIAAMSEPDLRAYLRRRLLLAIVGASAAFAMLAIGLRQFFGIAS